MKRVVIYCTLFSFLLFQFACSQNGQAVHNITTGELEQKLVNEKNSKDVLFIDVREKDEFEDGHIKGMSNLPLSTLKTDYHTIPKAAEVVIICRSGNRSMQAAELLKEFGYTKIVNVTGGMLDWHGEVIKK